MLKSAILFQNECRGLTLLIPIGGCACALDLACQRVCDKPLAYLYLKLLYYSSLRPYYHGPLCNEQVNVE